MKNLLRQESEDIFSKIVLGAMNEHEIIHFLLQLKEKGETKDEILGAIAAIKATTPLPVPPAPEKLLDVCGTGGDGLSTLNISTAVAFVVAGAGVLVAKHGNRAVSSKSGSADVLDALGVNITNTAKQQLDESGMCFLFAPNYYPALANLAPIRAKMKTHTIFNILGPLLNPLGAGKRLVGVYSPNLLRPFAEVLRDMGAKKAWVVYGAEGLDEVSLSGATQVCELEAGAIDTFTISPEDAGLERRTLNEIKGGDAAHNAAALLSLLGGAKGAYREIVLLNSAAALIVAGKTSSLEEGVMLAAQSIDSGKAKQVLEILKK